MNATTTTSCRACQTATPARKHFGKSKKITDSEPVNGEELLGSPELRRQLREAKERLKSEPPDPSRK